MGRRSDEHYNIKLGENSEPDNIAKLSQIYNKLKAKMILKELEGCSEDIRKEVLNKLYTDKIKIDG